MSRLGLHQRVWVDDKPGRVSRVIEPSVGMHDDYVIEWDDGYPSTVKSRWELMTDAEYDEQRKEEKDHARALRT